jgi:hypothetical protein
MVQKTDAESPGSMEKEVKAKKKPLISCDKYDEDERKALFGEGKES